MKGGLMKTVDEMKKNTSVIEHEADRKVIG